VDGLSVVQPGVGVLQHGDAGLERAEVGGVIKARVDVVAEHAGVDKRAHKLLALERDLDNAVLAIGDEREGLAEHPAHGVVLLGRLGAGDNVKVGNAVRQRVLGW